MDLEEREREREKVPLHIRQETFLSSSHIFLVCPKQTTFLNTRTDGGKTIDPDPFFSFYRFTTS